MKGKEFLKKLKRAGCDVEESRGKGGHYQMTYKGARSVVSFHGAIDLGPTYLRMVCKQSGLDPHDVL